MRCWIHYLGGWHRVLPYLMAGACVMPALHPAKVLGAASLVEATPDGRVVVRNADGGVVGQFQLDHRPVRTTFLLPEENMVFATQGQQTSRLNIATGEIDQTVDGTVVIGVSSNEKLVVTFDTTATLCATLRRAEDLLPIVVLDSNVNPRLIPTLAEFSPDARFLAVYYRPGYTWSDDAWLQPVALNLRGAFTRLYELTTGQQIQEFSTGTFASWPYPGHFTADGLVFVSDAGDHFDLAKRAWSAAGKEKEK